MSTEWVVHEVSCSDTRTTTGVIPYKGNTQTEMDAGMSYAILTNKLVLI